MMQYAGLYPISKRVNRDGNTLSVRSWIANVGEGQVEYSLFAMAANALASAGFTSSGQVIDNVMIWTKEEGEPTNYKRMTND